MTTPRPMRADARRNYERIVATAKAAFLEHGPDAPLDDIARRAEVGAGTLYRHFPSREALMEAVYRTDIETLSALAYELLDHHPPEQALRAWMRAQVAYAREKRGLATALKSAMDKESEVFVLCKTIMSYEAATVLKAGKDNGGIRPDVPPCDLL